MQVRQQLTRSGGYDLQMLGCDHISHPAGVLQVVKHDGAAVVRHALLDDVPAREELCLPLHLARNRLRLRHGIGQQDGGSQLVVLGLTEQVGGNVSRVGGVIGNDQHLGRACDHVNIDRAERQLLGCRNKGVARADDLVHLRDKTCAVGQRGNRLRAADGNNGIYTGDLRRRKHFVGHVFGRRRDHNQLTDTGNLGRNGVHQHTRRIRRCAARHINADARKPAHGLTERFASRAVPLPRFDEHLLVVVADVRRRLFQRRDQLRVAGVVRIVQHLRLDNVRRLAVKPLGVLHDRIPAALLYVRHHTADNLLNIAACTSRTGLHFADDLLLCLSVRLYYI